MSKQSDDYESFISKLVENINNSNRNLKKIKHGSKNKINGASGQKHQIDVSFVDNSFKKPTLVLIECKRFFKDTININHVKILKATLDDILHHPKNPNNAIALIITTTKNIRRGAKLFSKHYGIRIEKVNHSDSYEFQYENIIQIGSVVSLIASGESHVAHRRKCKKCNKWFEMRNKKDKCQKCNK